MKKAVLNKILFFLSILLAAFTECTAQIPRVSIYDLDSCMKIKAKPVLILFTAEWCKYCFAQKNEFKKSIARRNKENSFYYVEFDIEDTKNVLFNDRVYYYNPTGIGAGIHDFTIHIGAFREGVVCPAWVLIDQQYNILFKHPGLLSSDQLTELMKIIDDQLTADTD